MLNKMTFSALNYGTSDSIIWHKVNKHKASKDGRAAFLEMDTYQLGQGSEEVAAANAWAELNNLKLTPVYPGGAEVFLAKWEDAMDKLRDVGQAPTKFLEKTFLKDAVEDQDYSSVLTDLTLWMCLLLLRDARLRLGGKEPILSLAGWPQQSGKQGWLNKKGQAGGAIGTIKETALKKKA